jgi:hypothetical protein
MSTPRREGFRPQLEALEDRCTPSTLHRAPAHTPPPAHHVAPNTRPAFIFNPFQVSNQGIPVRNLASSSHLTNPSDGGFFPQGLGTNFFPPSIFHF